MASRPMLLTVLVLAAVMLPGCNLKDWYNQQGIVSLEVAFVADEPPKEILDINEGFASRLNDFSTMRVALRGWQMRQEGAANPLPDPPVPADYSDIRDVVSLAKGGQRVRVMEEKVSMRGFEAGQFKFEVLDGRTAAGETLLGCVIGVERPENTTCIRYDVSYARDLNPDDFRVPRGGTMTIVLPMYLSFRAGEYFWWIGAPYQESD